MRWSPVGERVVGAAARKPPAAGPFAAGILLWAFALHTPALAQQPGVRPLTPAEAEQERMRKLLQDAPKAYVDKVMTPGEAPDRGGPGRAEEDVGGFRSWFSETRLTGSTAAGDGIALRSSRELGQSVGYRRETTSHGGFELLADVRTSNGADPLNFGPAVLSTRRRSQRLTLRSTGFPVSTRWFADSTAGDTFSEVTDALARNYRLSLGTRPVRGVGTRVHAADTDLRAGIGERGNLLGGPFPGFERTGGTLAWLGASRRTAFGIVGLQVNRASGPARGFLGAVEDEEITSAAAAWRWSGKPTPGLEAAGRLTAIHSRSAQGDAPAASASGWFAEGSLLADHGRHEFGLFRADPGLRFGDARIYDARGAYWRVDGVRASVGWGVGAQVDDQAPEGAAPGSRHVGLQSNLQVQIDRRSAVGGSIGIDRRRPRGSDPATGAGAARSESLYATAYYQRQAPGSGRSRFTATLRRNQALVVNGSAATGEELSWEQEWYTSPAPVDAPAVVTTLGIARDREDGLSRISPTAGLRLSYSPAPRWNVSANLRYTSTRSSLSTTQGLSGFLDTDYAFDNGWRIGAALTLNQVAVNLDDPTLLPGSGPQLVRSRDAYLSLWARWEGAAGSTPRGLGASARSVGAGALQGRVFFDENRDGEQQSQEQGVAGVEVILDGRFRITTDNFGRFAFPLVATGPHEVTLRQESVPLPWGLETDRGWRVEVPLRGQADLVVPVVKVGG